MDAKINLADPDFEPSDEQLQELMRRAFAHIPEQNERRLRLMHERIELGRIELLKQLRAKKAQIV
jgi:predicted Zn-dependent protease with MMP-like domain